MLFGAALFALAFGVNRFVRADTLADQAQSIRAEFPEVLTIQTADLSEWLTDPKRTPPILVDVRDEKEFAVSRLPGAFRAENNVPGQLRGRGATGQTPIVVYCSVGLRSARLARDLRNAGFTNVRNLEGSIFAWANEKRPLIAADGPTAGVHPYNIKWGRYLDKTLWQWDP